MPLVPPLLLLHGPSSRLLPALPSFSLPSRGGLISGAQGETPWCDVLWLTLQAVLAAWASPEVSLDWAARSWVIG